MSNGFESLILITNKSQLIHALRLYDILSLSGRRPLILTEEEIEIESGRYFFKKLSHYQEIFKINFSEIKQATYDLFYSLTNQRVYNNTALKDLTSYKGVSLWELSAHYIFSEFASILYYIKITDAILEFEKPQQVYVIDNEGSLETIFNLICKKKFINFSIEMVKHSLFYELNKVLNKAFGDYILFLKKVKRLIISFYFLFFNLLKSHRLQKGYKVIFFAPTKRFFLSMLPVILKYNDSERLVINTFLSGPDKKLKENKIFYIDFYGYKLYPLFDRKVRSFLKKIRHAIYKNAFFGKILYRELNIGPLLAEIFERVICEQFPEKIRNIDIIRKILLTYRPKTVVSIDCSPDIILTGKSLSVSVLAMQSLHPEDFIFLGPVMADAITVDGNYWREYLCRHDVNPAKIWITGSPRFDFLQNESLGGLKSLPASERYGLKTLFLRPRDKKSDIEKLGSLSNSDKLEKIVIFATSPSVLAMGSLRYQGIARLKSVCEAMRNIKQAHLTIKLHPCDSDFEMYENIAQKAGLSNYSIIKDVDMLKLLHHCDLLISHLSTVSYEAVLMGKNLILLCGSSDFRNDDVWDFRRYGVAVFIDDLRDLENQIYRILFVPEARSMLKKSRQEYIYEHAYKLDGNAAVRTKAVIDRFAGKH